MDDLNGGQKSGMKTVLAEEVRAGVPVAAAEQLALMPLRQVGAEDGGAEPDVSSRGAGRPKGSRNKNTEEMRRWLLGRYRSPLEVMAETFSRSMVDLAKELGWQDPSPTQLLEILKLQLQCAKELAPYVHSKQPQAVDLGDQGLVQLIINTGAHGAAQDENASLMPLNFLDSEIVENQGLTEDGDGKSVAAESVDCQKNQEEQGEDDEKGTD